jgi:shikimate kinase
MRIYLVGFMGSGKSSLGQRVAANLEVPFFDTDSVVEAQAGMTIPEIFETFGELYFRQVESDILRQTTFYPKSLNATGGGLPCFENNMAWMNLHGITIYLQWPDQILRDHLVSIRQSRPLLASLDDSEASLKINDLLSVRKPIYEQSAITVELKGDEESDFKLLEKACKYIW